MNESPLVSVIVPCFNEQTNIAPLYARLSEALAPYASQGTEILFIDDASADETWQALTSLAHNDPHVSCIRLRRNFGHQMAITCGLAHARGQRILVIDADLQDPPELLSEMMRQLDNGADVAYGQRTARLGETMQKKFTAWCFYRLLNLCSDITIPNDAGDFRLMTREVAQALINLPERVRYTRGLVSWLGFTHAPVPYQRQARHSGSTKYSLVKMLGLARDGITSFSTRPLQLATWLGAAMMALSLALLAYVFASWLFFDTVRGWTSLAAIFLLSQSVLWLVLGIMGNYIAVIFRESKQRPLYLVRDTRNVSMKS